MTVGEPAERRGRFVREVNYDDRQHHAYAKARALSDETMAEWMRVSARTPPQPRPLPVPSLGSGTARFAPALAETFGGPVYGVEPSQRMRAVAEEHAIRDAVTYLDGSAEKIPLPDASCDLVLLFLVLHH